MPNKSSVIQALCLLFITLNYAEGQVTANFTSNDNSGCAPLNVSFTDASSSTAGSISSWFWEVNNVQFANIENPNRLFETPGNYTICLTATDSEGNTDRECKTNFIQVFAIPVADFTSTSAQGCLPLEVFFENNSSSEDGTITALYWDLGGSCGVLEETNLQNTSCVYNEAGNFQITLIAEDNNGCVGIQSIENYVTAFANPMLDIDFDLISNCDAPFQANFINNNPDPDIFYNWDFGNGQTSNQPAPQGVNYNSEGPFDVTVISTNTQTGCRDTMVISDGIQAGYDIDYAFEIPGGCGTLDINFEELGENAVDSIRWNFGDGNSTTSFSPSYEYTTFGCYDIEMTAYISGCPIVVTKEVCLLANGADIAASLSVSNTNSCTTPFVVGFNVNTTQPVEWVLNFGDGSSSTIANPSHQYVDFGIYPVALTLTNAAGCSRIIRDTINIIDTEAVMPNITYNGCAPQTIELIENSNTATSIVSWNWTVIDPNGDVDFTSTSSNPIYTAPIIGCYDIILEIEDAQGCTDMQRFNEKICLGTAPDVSMIASPVLACASQTLTFEGITNDNVDYWAWDFNQDFTFDEFDQISTYQYRDTGCFDITLLASEFGCETIITEPGFVCIEPPVARFNTTLDCAQDFDRIFSSTSFGADSVNWDFGIVGIENDTSTSSPAAYSFPDTGTYTVMLVAYNFGTGCTDTVRSNIMISDPAAGFTLSETEFCLGETIMPVDNSDQAVSYLWSTTGGTVTAPATATPTIRFNTSGEHSVQLIIEDENECTDTTVFAPVFVNEITPGFTVSQSGECLPIIIDFVDTSTNLYGINNSWTWILGDTLAVLDGQNPSFESQIVGTVPVELVVTDSWGCSASIDDFENLVINAPFSSFTGDTISCPGLPLTFSNASTGQALNYSWDFGDGVSSSDENPEHAFDVGTFNVCLTVENVDACQHESCMEVEVVEVAAGIGVDDSYSICPPSTIEFFSTSENAVSFEWEFGDNSGGSDAEDPSHIYIQDGAYDVSLTVYGSNMDCIDSIQIDSLVQLGIPTGDFSFTIDQTCVPSTVTFTGNSDFQFDYTWFFDDGNSVTTLGINSDTVTYQYTFGTEVGFVPKLLLFDSENCDMLVVSPDTLFLNALEVDFLASDTFLCDGDRNVVFESLIEVTGGVDYIEWSFENATPNGSDSYDLSVDFNAPGMHDVSLLVRSGECEVEVIKEQLVWIVDSVTVEVDDVIACIGDTIQLSVNSNATEFVWTPSEFFIGSDTAGRPVFFATEDMAFSVEGRVLSCTPANDDAFVTVNTLPEVNYTSSWDFFPGQSVQMDLNVVSEGVFSYDWEPSEGLSCINCPNPSIIPDTSMVLTATVTNEETGCETIIDIFLNELRSCPEELIGVANAFSPNNDGNNDLVELYSSTIEEIDVFRIFSRWGELMFEGTNMDDGWDGTYKGVKMNPGVYVYFVEAPCPINDTKLLKKGDVTLFR